MAGAVCVGVADDEEEEVVGVVVFRVVELVLVELVLVLVFVDEVLLTDLEVDVELLEEELEVLLTDLEVDVELLDVLELELDTDLELLELGPPVVPFLI